MATGAREENAMRALKYVGLGIAGLVVLAVAAFFVAPHVIDWNSRKGEIAEQLAAATGKELKIDGDISVAWTTTATFRIDGIRLVDNYDGKSIDVVAIERVSGEVALIPLLSGRLEVLDLAIVKPTFDLRVDRSGRANWAAEAGEARAGGRKADDGDDEGLPVDDIIIRNLSVSDGALAFANRASGQKIAASAIGLALKMPSLDYPLTLDGEMTLNGEPVTLKTTVNNPRGLLEGPGAAIDFGFKTTHARSGFAGKVVKGEVTGVDGTLMLDLPTVAKLAAWLGRPLAKGQPDPGAVNLKAVFKSDGAVVTLQKATILGKALNVEATGSIDAGKTTKVVRLKVTSGVLDIDRYLPPPEKTGGSKPARKTGMSASPFAALSDEPFELAALRVRPETLCRITEFSEHESNGREFDEGERVAVEVLPVLGQSAAAVEPGDGAFDHPTPGLDDEALHPIGSLDDLGLEIGQDAGQGAVKDRPLIGAVGEQFPEKGKQTEQGRQQRETAVAILNVGGGDDAVQQQALRIDQNMPLLALDQLAGIEAVAVDASPPFSALFTL